jgi:hypothetical protein
MGNKNKLVVMMMTMMMVMVMMMIIIIIIIIIGKIYKNAIHNLGCVEVVFNTFLHNGLVMYVSINKRLISIQNSVGGTLSRLWQGKV